MVISALYRPQPLMIPQQELHGFNKEEEELAHEELVEREEIAESEESDVVLITKVSE